MCHRILSNIHLANICPYVCERAKSPVTSISNLSVFGAHSVNQKMSPVRTTKFFNVKYNNLNETNNNNRNNCSDGITNRSGHNHFTIVQKTIQRLQ